MARQLSSSFCTLIEHTLSTNDRALCIRSCIHFWVLLSYSLSLIGLQISFRPRASVPLPLEVHMTNWQDVKRFREKNLCQKTNAQLKCDWNSQSTLFIFWIDRISSPFKIYLQNCRRTSSLLSPPPCTSFLLQSKSLTLQTWLIVVLFLRQSLNAQ